MTVVEVQCQIADDITRFILFKCMSPTRRSVRRTWTIQIRVVRATLVGLEHRLEETMSSKPKVAVVDFVHVRYAVEHHIATITLDRPERRNALNYRAYDELESAFRIASSEADVRCVIVTGADPAFCSGDDVREIMAGPTSIARAERRADPKPTPAAMAALQCECPVIAAINGAA